MDISDKAVAGTAAAVDDDQEEAEFARLDHGDESDDERLIISEGDQDLMGACFRINRQSFYLTK